MAEAATRRQSECGPARHLSSRKPRLASANTRARRSPASSPSCSIVPRLVGAHRQLSAGAVVHRSPRCQGSLSFVEPEPLHCHRRPEHRIHPIGELHIVLSLCLSICPTLGLTPAPRRCPTTLRAHPHPHRPPQRSTSAPSLLPVRPLLHSPLPATLSPSLFRRYPHQLA
jgi:hypothetical protein